MRIEIKHKNKELEVIGVEEFTLNEYCHLLSRKALSLLYQIEDMKNGYVTFEEIKKNIFNLAGSMERLPDNLIDDQAKEVKVKKPESSFFDFILRKGVR